MTPTRRASRRRSYWFAHICVLLLTLCSIGKLALGQVMPGYALRLPREVTRIEGEIDDSHVMRLRGDTHPLATATRDQGPVPADHPMQRMLMLLQRDPDQEAALDQFLAAQQNPRSPLFHHWLSPEQFGAWFGPAESDLQTITNWLDSHGFKAVSASKGRTVIEFTGTVSQVQSTFHTEIHQYMVNGTLHLANQRDPSIPEALAPVVAGLVSLNDFGRRSMALRGPTVYYTKGSGRPHIEGLANPDFTFKDGALNYYGVGPYDFAAIYDLLPLWKAGLDGSGQTIAIVGQTEIHSEDAILFREFFGLLSQQHPIRNEPRVHVDGLALRLFSEGPPTSKCLAVQNRGEWIQNTSATFPNRR